MSQENVEMVRKSLQAFLENDFEAWFAVTDPGCKVYPRPEEPGVKECYEGWDEILEYLVNWYSGWKEYTGEPERFIDAGDWVVVEQKEVGITGNGMRVEQRFAYAFKIENGKGVELRMFGPVEEAFEALDLSEQGAQSEIVQPGELALNMTRVLPAPPPVVFKALTEPDALAKWWGPSGFTAPSVEVDLQGGSYRIAMQPPDGDLFYLSGEFLEVDPPAHLAYTFRWEDPDPDDRETVVALSLRDLGESTELVLTQRTFATEARHALHEQGWTDCLDRLHELMASQASGET
jgi:uncharacterized protein YndB with AHSA1/START domain/ketosteroid isomerase-like protein